MFPKSIRFRIQFWHTLLLTIIVASLLTAFYQNERQIAFQKIDRELSEPIPSLLPRPGGRGGRNAGPPGRRERDRERGRPPARRLLESFRDEGFTRLVSSFDQKGIYVAVWTRGGKQVFASENTPPQAEPPIRERKRETVFRTVGDYREAIQVRMRGEFLVVGKSIAPLKRRFELLFWQLLGAGILIVGGGFAIGWILTGRSLFPIQRIRETATQIAAGDLSSRIQIHEDRTELGQLSSVLNTTFEELEQSFQKQIRFTADASHELRTPISVILAKAQLALRKERSAQKYQEALQTCQDSAQHMRQVTDSLLDLAKIDSGNFVLHRSRVDFRAEIKSVLEMLSPLAERKQLKIQTELPDHKIEADIDSPRFRQVLLNLLGNAVKYHRADGLIRVSLRESSSDLLLLIEDDGPGISADHLPHIFDRFFRVDQARTTNQEGSTGLGLSIAKVIVEAHGGNISVQSALGKGTTFVVKIPQR